MSKTSKRECRVYVGNLSYDVRYRDLMEFMRGGGFGLGLKLWVGVEGCCKEWLVRAECEVRLCRLPVAGWTEHDRLEREPSFCGWSLAESELDVDGGFIA